MDHVKAMNSSTPKHIASLDAQQPHAYEQDKVIPSSSRQRSIGSTIALGDSTFDSLALDVSYSSLEISETDFKSSIEQSRSSTSLRDNVSDIPELWEDIGVVKYLEKKLGSHDESTPEERVETLREILAETDIHEGDGDLSDFLFHVARTKHGKVYIRVIRTFLLNRGKH